MLAYFESTLTWSALVKRTYRELLADDGLGLAAQLAYYFVLALFPALLCVIALATLLPLEHFTDELVAMLVRVAPPEMGGMVRDEIARLAAGNDGGMFSIGLLGALWSSSAAMVALIDAMNRAYDIEEARPWWKVRITAIALTVALAAFIVTSFGIIVAGPAVARWAADHYALGSAFLTIWSVSQWPIAFALIVTGIALIYYFAPDADQDFTWIAPGSLLAATLLVIASAAFRFYVLNFGNYEATYGAIAGVILLMLWCYIAGLVLVIGAEASAEIEHASPWGKAPAEKVPGERRKIGSAAGRAFRARGVPPSPATIPVERSLVPAPAPAPRPAPAFWERAAAVAVVLLLWRRKRVNN